MTGDYEDNDMEEVIQQLTNDEKFNGSPRSKLVEAVIILLYARPLRTSEIASNLGYETKYVSSYLSYWKKKGLVYQEGGRWHLSRKGEELAKEILDSYTNSKFKEMLVLAKQILDRKEQVKQTMNYKEEKKSDNKNQKVLWFIDNQTSKVNKKGQKQEITDCIKEILEKLEEDEKEILINLLNKYKEWGTTYIYLDQLQEEIRADTNWIFKVLRGLQTKRLIYIYQDPRMGIRIGLSQQLRKLISEC
ncbi:replication initiator protein WhiP [Sulfolobus sp. A20]|uniref:replication initiator protein WhiP n=1 Tax=Saccharolobus sp. A20 TaxID=1891280 RepID=UPI0008461462|nr:replication initiator protein WhiP [Sulfolobus sp. A20]TRM78192.1 replication initiator protein WhiP [Sulfolobus sp. A20-N-F8]TRM81617.1 replication initiator protein WhiP [Sulfolobus sp. D5]TRM82884.1 replication initiator protein WhiP [Sulfolobus sp. A20-N-F6]TRM86721.1 replication initiator protein WhiP [Sulfolobus sp. E3]TRM88855.1 replication initiator protein WhiP [Sulfolobus sp. C3]TRM98363.1 replication initiator protein WhiP [Sulfolobus sp. F1]TRN01192.1 replication initiator pro